MNSASGEVAPVSPGLVPELLITDLATSLNFWVTASPPSTQSVTPWTASRATSCNMFPVTP